MGRTAKPRKQYRPRPVIFNNIAHTIESAQVLRRDSVAKVIACLKIARSDLLKGDMEQGWRAVVDALNVAQQLAAIGICSDDDSRDAISRAHIALAKVYDRFTKTGSATLYAAEVTAIDAAIERHEIQLNYCSRREYDMAIERTINRVRAALAGSLGPGVNVCGNLGTNILDHHELTAAIPQPVQSH